MSNIATRPLLVCAVASLASGGGCAPSQLRQQLVTQSDQLNVCRNVQKRHRAQLRRLATVERALSGHQRKSRKQLRVALDLISTTRYRLAACRRKAVTARAIIRPPDHVKLQEELLWGGRVTTALSLLLRASHRRLAACYVAHVTARGKAGVAMLRVLYRVTTAGIRRVRLHRSSRGGNRALRRCVAEVIRTQALPRPRRAWRISQAFAFGPTRQLTVNAPYAAYKFPWTLPTRLSAGPGQICRARQHRTLPQNPPLPRPGARPLTGAEDPFYSRPCAPGLRCCSSCGAPGCASRCQRKCRKLPGRR